MGSNVYKLSRTMTNTYLKTSNENPYYLSFSYYYLKLRELLRTEAILIIRGKRFTALSKKVVIVIYFFKQA